MHLARGTLALTFVGAIGCTTEPDPSGRSTNAAVDAEPVTAPEGHDAADGAGDASGEMAHEPPADGAIESGTDAAMDGAAGDAGSGGPAVDAAMPCTPATVSARLAVPEVMIVLDRSQSMAPAIPVGVSCVNYDAAMDSLACNTLLDPAACDRLACAGVDCGQPPYAGTVVCGGANASPAVDRWTVAVKGIKQLTRDYQSKFTFGLTTFPGESTSGGAGADLCAAGTERVALAPNAAPAIAQTLDGTRPGGATPTSATLTRVLQRFQARGAAPQYALLMTDGQPTCPNANGNTLNPQLIAMDQALAVQALDALREAGVKTYVFGFVGSNDASLAPALSELALHGGTENFSSVQDAQSLATHFAAIAPALRSCSYQLEKAPADAKYLRVELDGVPLERDAAQGWSIDRTLVTLRGDACAKLVAGASPVLTVVLACEAQAP